MDIEITATITAPNGTVHTEQIGAITKTSDTIGEIGLSIGESKDLLLKLQQEVVSAQCAAFCARHTCCALTKTTSTRRSSLEDLLISSVDRRRSIRDLTCPDCGVNLNRFS